MDRIEKVQIHKEYEKGLSLMREYKDLVKSMEMWLDIDNPEVEKKLMEGCKSVGMKRKKPEEVFLDCICDGNVCHLKGADIEFIDRKSFWLTCKELLVNEDYYLELDKEEPVILDCGTNIGLAIYYYKMRWPKAKVIGFEPWDRAYEVATRNCKNNNWENVTIYPYGLLDEEGEMVFHTVEGNSVGGTLTERAYDNATEVLVEDCKVQTKRLSNFIEGEIDFIKMDIEGAEKKVLYEIETYFPKVNHMFIEYHYSKILDDNSLTDILNLLEKYEFLYYIGLAEAFQKSRSKKPMTYVGRKTSMSIFAAKMKEESKEKNE